MPRNEDRNGTEKIEGEKPECSGTKGLITRRRDSGQTAEHGKNRMAMVLQGIFSLNEVPHGNEIVFHRRRFALSLVPRTRNSIAFPLHASSMHNLWGTRCLDRRIKKLFRAFWARVCLKRGKRRCDSSRSSPGQRDLEVTWGPLTDLSRF